MFVCIKCRVGDLTTLGRFAGSMSVDLQLSRYVNADSAFILYVLYVCMYVCAFMLYVCIHVCLCIYLFMYCMYVCIYVV